MSDFVISGARLTCSCGLGLSTLIAPPRGVFHSSGAPLATTTDALPGTHIAPFSQCSAPAVVAQAALTGQPPLCMPKLAGAWSVQTPGVTIAGLSALAAEAVLPCTMGGLIRIQTLISQRVSYSPAGSD